MRLSTEKLRVLLVVFFLLQSSSLLAPPGPGAALNQHRVRNIPHAGALQQTNQRSTGQGTVAEQAAATLFNLRPSGDYYNQLKIPQFSVEFLGDANITNGVGNGGVNSFYCSDQDEKQELRYWYASHRAGFGEPRRDQSPNRGDENRGSYQCLRLIDRCKTEGCGPLVADDKSFVLCLPQYATNCHPAGKFLQWNDPDPSLYDQAFNIDPNPNPPLCGDGQSTPMRECNPTGRCGDGVRQNWEDCDIGIRETNDNLTYTRGCDTLCRRLGNNNPGDHCGNGIREDSFGIAIYSYPGYEQISVPALEECDDGDADNNDACVNCYRARCGDGFVQTGIEECDDGNNAANDGCNPTCEIEDLPDRPFLRVTDGPFSRAARQRNYFPDLRYGRYLVRMIHGDISAAAKTRGSTVTSDNSRATVDNFDSPESKMKIYDTEWASPYNFEAFSPYYVDIPYSLQDLKWGFTCPQVAHAGGYQQANPGLQAHSGGVGNLQELGQDHRNHYLRLLKVALNEIGNQIADKQFGDFYRNRNWTTMRTIMTGQERMMSEIVLNIHGMLTEVRDDIDGASEVDLADQVQATTDEVAESVESVLRTFFPFSLLPDNFVFLMDLWRYREIKLMSGPVADGTLLEYDPANARFILNTEVAADCGSRRAMRSDPHFNASNCTPSYGHFDGTHGLVETLYTEPGYELQLGTRSGRERITSDRLSGDVSVDGYSPVIVSLLAHQAIHAQRCRDLGVCPMANWPSPEAIWEESLAIMAQSMVLKALCVRGYCPYNQDVESMDFVRMVGNNSSGDVTNLVTSSRVLFPEGCRGYGGRSLGPYCLDMFNIARLLEEKEPENARMIAFMVSQAPLLDPPALMTVDGVERQFSLPLSGATINLEQTRSRMIQEMMNRDRMNTGTGRMR